MVIVPLQYTLLSIYVCVTIECFECSFQRKLNKVINFYKCVSAAAVVGSSVAAAAAAAAAVLSDDDDTSDFRAGR